VPQRPDNAFGLQIDPDSKIALQSQIRQQLIEGIFAGRFQPGQRLPSSRRLSKALGVARNTVLLAYQQLIDEGHVISRTRSGLYLNETLSKGHGSVTGMRSPARQPQTADWSKHLRRRPAIASVQRYPADWQTYRYPFIDGCFDRALFPRQEWRATSRIAASRQQIDTWSLDSADADDPELIRQIRTRILPRRGISAAPDEIMITAGTEAALHLLLELLVDDTTTVAIEEPGHIAMRELLRRRGARLVTQRVDGDGIVVDSRLDAAELVYVTPSHQRPIGVTLSMRRRAALLKKAAARDFRIIEDDVDSATNYLEDAPAALRAMPGGERVIYVADFSAVLAPTVRLGYIVAAPEIIRAAHELRALLARNPPLSNQRMMALLLSLGHYDAAMLRLGSIFRERLFALREALNHYLQRFIAIVPARGGTTYWIRGPKGIDAADLAREAALRGILIEPVADYFAAPNPQRNLFRMGVTGLSADRVRAGVASLSEVLRDIEARRHPARGAARSWLSGDMLEQRMQGATLSSRTVYGEPYTISLLPGGRMLGRAGHAGEDRDEGRWWVGGAHWYRQWRSWAYGEPSGYLVRIQGEQIHLFNDRRQLVDVLSFIAP
jgi:GntR family transcriptional regulator/MocR family aminotransferase